MRRCWAATEAQAYGWGGDLGDTIGAGTPLAACRLVEATAHRVPLGRIAVHFHDTRGQALACLGLGVSIIYSAVAGLRGCPYAPGASGNVAAECVAYLPGASAIASLARSSRA